MLFDNTGIDWVIHAGGQRAEKRRQTLLWATFMQVLSPTCVILFLGSLKENRKRRVPIKLSVSSVLTMNHFCSKKLSRFLDRPSVSVVKEEVYLCRQQPKYLIVVVV